MVMIRMMPNRMKLSRRTTLTLSRHIAA